MYKAVLSLITAALLTAVLSVNAHAFDCSEININSFVEETQLSTDDSDRLLLFWWIPIEYWCVSTSTDPSVTEDDLKQFEDILKDYTIIAVVDGNMSVFGAVTFRTLDEVKPAIKLKDKDGKTYEPLADKDINPDTRSFLSILKPILGNMMGDMGENMHFVVFPAHDGDGNRIDDPLAAGPLTAVYDGVEYTWRRPLGSMLAGKVCPKCKEKCPGSWNFCPYDGTELP